MSCIATGKYLPNRMGLYLLQSLEESIGRDGRLTIAREADPDGLWPAPPPDNLEKTLDFCFYASICDSLDARYGDRAARKILFSASRASFRRFLPGISALGGLDEPMLLFRSGSQRIDHCLAALSRLLHLLSDIETTFLPAEPGRPFAITDCPECAGREQQVFLCAGMAGMIRGMLDWLGVDDQWRVTETACIANGASRCDFQISA